MKTNIPSTTNFQGQKIKDLRILKGMTLEEVATMVECDPSSMSLWERNERRPNVKSLRRIAEFFKVPISTFFLIGFVTVGVCFMASLSYAGGATSAGIADGEAMKLSQLNPEFRSKVVEMLEMARASWPDKKIVIAEAFRSQSRQNRLYKKGRTTTTVKKSKHTEGLAADIYFVDSFGVIIPYGDAPYDELGVIAESVGLCWGGRWKVPFDPGHFQLGFTGDYYKNVSKL